MRLLGDHNSYREKLSLILIHTCMEDMDMDLVTMVDSTDLLLLRLGIASAKARLSRKHSTISAKVRKRNERHD